jgi:hypothetical protein
MASYDAGMLLDFWMLALALGLTIVSLLYLKGLDRLP